MATRVGNFLHLRGANSRPRIGLVSVTLLLAPLRSPDEPRERVQFGAEGRGVRFPGMLVKALAGSGVIEKKNNFQKKKKKNPRLCFSASVIQVARVRGRVRFLNFSLHRPSVT